jgi:hypothetical protein
MNTFQSDLTLGKNILFGTITGVVAGIAMAPLLMLTGILAGMSEKLFMVGLIILEMQNQLLVLNSNHQRETNHFNFLL